MPAFGQLAFACMPMRRQRMIMTSQAKACLQLKRLSGRGKPRSPRCPTAAAEAPASPARYHPAAMSARAWARTPARPTCAASQQGHRLIGGPARAGAAFRHRATVSGAPWNDTSSPSMG